MIDLDELAAQLEAACIDKCDLFDFYNAHWGALVAEITELRAEVDQLKNDLVEMQESRDYYADNDELLRG